MNFKKITLFISLTFLLSWLIASLFFALGGKWGTPASILIACIYMFVPMIVAIIVQKCVYKEPIKKPLGISFKLNRWFLIAWLLPTIIAFLTIAMSLAMPNVELSINPEETRVIEQFKSVFPPERIQEIQKQTSSIPVHPIWLALFSGLIAGITINAVAGFGEELGWRGFLQREFSYLGFWKSSIIIGFIWGIWYAPIILQGHNYLQHPKVGVFMMVAVCILLAPLFSYIRLKARSVIAAAIIHGSLNATYGIPLIVIKGGNDLTVGVTGLAGFIVLAFVNIALLLYDRLLAKESILCGRINL